MILKDLKFICKIMRYSFEIKKFLGWGIGFMALAVVLSLLPVGVPAYGFLLAEMAPIMLFQGYMGLNYFRIVQVSPRCKDMLTGTLSTVVVAMSLGGYAVGCLLAYLRVLIGYDTAQKAGANCLLMAVVMAVLLFYFLISYRWFILSVAILYVLMIVGAVGLQVLRVQDMILNSGIGSWGVLIGVVLICVMWLPLKGLAELIYKRPLDPKAMGAMAKNQLV